MGAIATVDKVQLRETLDKVEMQKGWFIGTYAAFHKGGKVTTGRGMFKFPVPLETDETFEFPVPSKGAYYVIKKSTVRWPTENL